MVKKTYQKLGLGKIISITRQEITRKYPKYNPDSNTEIFETDTSEVKYIKLFDTMPDYAQDLFIQMLSECEASNLDMPMEVKWDMRLVSLSFFLAGFMAAEND